MKAILRILVSATPLLLGMTLCSQTKAPSFSLKVHVSPGTAKVGSAFVVEIARKNETNAPMETILCVRGQLQCGVTVHVRDSHGNAAPRNLIAEPGVLVAGPPLEPGKTTKFSSDQLTKFFDLRRPDRYEIQLESYDPFSNTDVKSNVAHFVVTAP